MDTTTTSTGHEKSQEDPTARSDAMLKDFMRGKTLPASYKEWKVCHHCSKREPAGEPFRQCGHCKAMGVEQFVLYCSRECQKGDWPEHKKICGDQQLTYDMKKDTGYVFLKPGSNKTGRLLLEWNHVYRRMLVSHSPAIQLAILLNTRGRYGQHAPFPEGSKKVNMTVRSHNKDGGDPPIGETQEPPNLDREPPPIAVRELCLFDEHMIVVVPMLPCDQDAYFAPRSDITADACPQWAFMLHLLSLHAPRSSTIFDSLLDGLLGYVAELENRKNHRSPKFSAPTLGFQPWSVYNHGVSAWLLAMAPFIVRWRGKFHPEMSEETWAKKTWADTISAVKDTMQEMLFRSR